MNLPQKLTEAEQRLSTVQAQLADAKAEVGKSFPKEAELQAALQRLGELNALLNMDERGDSPLAAEILENSEEADAGVRPEREAAAENVPQRISMEAIFPSPMQIQRQQI